MASVTAAMMIRPVPSSTTQAPATSTPQLSQI
jgi:hypothetical protein